MATTGTVNDNGFGLIELTGTNPTLNVFNLTASQVSLYSYLNIKYNVPTSSTVLVNIIGSLTNMPQTTVEYNGSQISTGTIGSNYQTCPQSRIIWNLSNATTAMQMTGVGFQGTLLAPWASITSQQGEINGQVICESMSQSQSWAAVIQVHCTRFQGCLPSNTPTCNADAGANQTACSGACINLTGVSPNNGTWSEMIGNPIGASLGSTSAGVAQVCFSANASGTFNFIYSESSTCSDTMSVVVNSTTSNSTTQLACDSYTWSANGTTYTSSGTYTYSTTNGNGCPHDEILNLTINTSTSNSTTQSACDSYTWSANGTTYTSSGTYTYSTTNGNGCPHNEILNLTINTSTSNTTTQSACDSYTWSANGTTYTSSGTYTYSTTNGNGCPHNEILNLTINTSTSNTTTQSACDSYTWSANGTTYTTSGTYTYSTTNGNGCSHTEILNLTFDKGFIGNYVWNDVNQNGIQNMNEVGVSGVTVSLLKASNNEILSTVTTDAYGYYRFGPICAGSYRVKFSLPSNYIFTGQNAPDDITDSDPNVFTGITDIYVVAAGDSNMTVDAGIYQPLPVTATVGNRVWLDMNSNGIQDIGESGVSGITVSLYSCTNPSVPVSTTITDAGGNYLFENVLAGNYQVGFSVPLGMLLTVQSGIISEVNNSDANPQTKETSCFTVNSGDNITYVDAGLVPKSATTSSLGDRVWNDANQDGIQDANETGVQGVTVTLYEQNGINVITTTTTDGLGNYAFNGITAGCYVIGFSNLPSGYTFSPSNAGTDSSKNSDANISTGNTGVICIAPGQNNPTIDAGIYNNSNTNSIGDRVWYDVDKNGIQDGSEYGYPGVVVTLYDCNNNTVVATTTTNADGNYLFSGLANGSYYVGFGFIQNFRFSAANADLNGINGVNNSDANPSSGLTDCVTLSGNTNISFIDAGIYPGNGRTATSTLGDRVWVDVNSNGLQDSGEPGVPNVKVTLYESDGNTIIDTTNTDGLGNYIFTNLSEGEFVIGFSTSTLPSGYNFTAQVGTLDDENNSDVNSSTGKTGVVVLGLGEDKLFVDAGIVAPSNTVCLGDYVWIDLDNDGIQETNEPGVPGVTVKLYSGSSNTVLQVATTSEEGSYMFCGLVNGSSYSVGFENLPTGFTFTTQTGTLATTDNSDANPATGRTTTVTLGATNDLTLDAGIYSPTTAVVGNYVWYDEDADGIQDPTEAPIPGVLVTLYDNTNTPVASAVTDANGGYLFTNVTPDTYTIGFEGYPSTLVPTIKGGNASADDDSNVDPITGRTDAFTVTPGSSNLTLDAGYKANPIAGLGNYVWFDINENGLQEASEPGIPGVLVTLYASDGVTALANAITDGNGAYSFPNLVASSYIVGFSNVPSDYVKTINVGSLNDALNSDIDASNKTSLINLVEGTYNPNIDAGFIVQSTLPIQLSHFGASIKGCTTILTWATSSEQQSSHIDIERRSPQGAYTKVGSVQAKGSSSTLTSYTYSDAVGENGSYIYRLKMVDIDGRYSYSTEKSVTLNCTENEIVLYPNPTQGSTTVLLNGKEMGEIYEVSVLDMRGAKVYSTAIEISSQSELVNLPLENLSAGIYSVQVTNGTDRAVFKLNKQ